MSEGGDGAGWEHILDVCGWEGTQPVRSARAGQGRALYVLQVHRSLKPQSGCQKRRKLWCASKNGGEKLNITYAMPVPLPGRGSWCHPESRPARPSHLSFPCFKCLQVQVMRKIPFSILHSRKRSKSTYLVHSFFHSMLPRRFRKGRLDAKNEPALSKGRPERRAAND